MQLTIAHIGSKSELRGGGGSGRGKDGYESITVTYIERCAAYYRTQGEAFRSEASFIEWLDRQHGRTPVFPVFLDSVGKQMGSESFAAWLGARRDEGTQHIVFAIGPPDGWSATAKGRAKLLLSLGQMTMVHPLARLVLAEQVYRACTILAGHPYHTGH